LFSLSVPGSLPYPVHAIDTCLLSTNLLTGKSALTRRALPVSSWKAASGNRGKATREAAAPPNAWYLVSERMIVPGGRIARPDPDFEVMELPAAVLLVGSSNTGFETTTVIGYKSDFIAKLAGRPFATAGSPLWSMTSEALAQLMAAGFAQSAIWREAEQTQVFTEVPAEPGIYALVVDGEVRYIGKATRRCVAGWWITNAGSAFRHSADLFTSR
jgi:hypothetical protein